MKKLVLSVACLAALALVAGLLSCGGGGDDGLVADGTINADNAGLLFGGAGRSVDLMTMGVQTSQMGGFGVASSEGGPGLFLRLVQEEVRRKMSGGLAAAGSNEMDLPCTTGNGHAVVTWDAPPELLDPCDISNVFFTATTENCSIDPIPITLNGGLSVRETGSVCNPSAMAVVLDNFSFSDGQVALNADLTLSYTGLVWLGGDVSSGVLEDAVCTLSGAASGTSSWCSASVQFQSFRLEYHNQGTITVAMSGYYRDDNLDGWVQVETLEPLVYNGADWPTSGRITVSGTGSAEFAFSGGVLTVTCDGAWVADNSSWAELCP